MSDEMTEDEFDQLVTTLCERFDEHRVAEQFDQFARRYADREQMQRRDIDSAYEWYVRFGTGEAERDVCQWMANELDREPSAEFNDAARAAFPGIL